MKNLRLRAGKFDLDQSEHKCAQVLAKGNLRLLASPFSKFLFFSLPVSNSRLELVPQLKKDGTPQSRTPNRFAMFVKQHYARIKSDHEIFSHQDVMKALSSEFAQLST